MDVFLKGKKSWDESTEEEIRKRTKNGGMESQITSRVNNGLVGCRDMILVSWVVTFNINNRMKTEEVLRLLGVLSFPVLI